MRWGSEIIRLRGSIAADQSDVLPGSRPAAASAWVPWLVFSPQELLLGFCGHISATDGNTKEAQIPNYLATCLSIFLRTYCIYLPVSLYLSTYLSICVSLYRILILYILYICTGSSRCVYLKHRQQARLRRAKVVSSRCLCGAGDFSYSKRPSASQQVIEIPSCI